MGLVFLSKLVSAFGRKSKEFFMHHYPFFHPFIPPHPQGIPLVGLPGLPAPPSRTASQVSVAFRAAQEAIEAARDEEEEEEEEEVAPAPAAAVVSLGALPGDVADDEDAE